jgi:hypothetical protein
MLSDVQPVAQYLYIHVEIGDDGGLRVPLRRECSESYDTLFIGSVHRSGDGLGDRRFWA